MEAGKRTINDIFNGNRVLEVPFFQRSYVWGNDQWERLLQDMETVSITNRPYFLGSVILKQQNTETNGAVGDVRTLIDGQQRLTTLNILFKVLSLKLNQHDVFNGFFRLRINREIALRHNYNDLAHFNLILDLEKERDDLGMDSKIKQAYDFFRTNVDLNKVSVQSMLNNVMFVGIDLGADEDEQQIFDTINSLGVRLTTAELLKNYFFRRDDVTLYQQNWQGIFEKDQETKAFWDRTITAGRATRQNIDLFFYSFLQIKVQDASLKVRTEDKKQFTRVEGLFDSYKRFIESYDLNKEQLIQEIREYAEIYRENIDYNVIDRELPADDGISRINAIIFGLENTTLIPYVLYVLKKVTDQAERRQIFDYLEAYLLRRMVCHETTKNYNQLFSERLIVNNVLTRATLSEQIESQSDGVNFMPNDDDLQRGFRHSRLTNKQTSGILYLIESKIRDRSKHSTSLLGLNRYSLEHVMPKKWQNNWPSLLEEEKRIERSRKLLTLGNLTIITASLNASIRDADWGTKKEGKGSKLGLKHYASGIDTFSTFMEREIWDESTIDERATFLFNKAKEIWGYRLKVEEQVS